MDRGPLRTQRPIETRVPAARPAPQPQAEEPVDMPTPKVARAKKQKDSKFRWGWMIVSILVVIVLAGGAWLFARNSDTGIDAGKYQVVFLTNGQLYFGKLSHLNGAYMELTDVYYLQPQNSDSEDAQEIESTSNSSNLQLVAGSGEVHSPENAMVISKDQIISYQNLKPEGRVAQMIDQMRAQ